MTAGEKDIGIDKLRIIVEHAGCGLNLLQCPTLHSLPGSPGSCRLSCLGQDARHGGGFFQSSSN